MIEVSVQVERAFHLPAPPAAAWAWLRDVPRWGALFPGVASVEPYEGGAAEGGAESADAFVWTMEPMGPPGARVTTVYACRYHADDGAYALSWTPIDGVGNARFAGGVALRDAPGGAAGTLRLEATLEVPAPRFARGVVEPAVAFEMGRMTDGFLDRLGGAVAG
ncbi:SRPBCC family protein [Rubrivirga sp. S365]|uniref:SRPBCC family protein n=1 Tax=Rubrivirga litoralis TaxID=3075598 RepID=A0ABU3BSX4_9BACT|nr:MULTISPECIES: SRPBCC family protein [unclassified Rubrivirga]MDT0632392.1 SRPBCC family protein [Rubrivirga sp. F394]MDT7855237.1 SRPBCC family protein [Rubrivirga sp. S365]